MSVSASVDSHITRISKLATDIPAHSCCIDPLWKQGLDNLSKSICCAFSWGGGRARKDRKHMEEVQTLILRFCHQVGKLDLYCKRKKKFSMGQQRINS